MLASLRDLPRSQPPCSVALSLAHSARLHRPRPSSQTRHSGASVAVCERPLPCALRACPLLSICAPSCPPPAASAHWGQDVVSFMATTVLSSKSRLPEEKGQTVPLPPAVQLPCCLGWGVRVRPGGDGLLSCPASHGLPALYPFFWQKGVPRAVTQRTQLMAVALLDPVLRIVKP